MVIVSAQQLPKIRSLAVLLPEVEKIIVLDDPGPLEEREVRLEEILMENGDRSGVDTRLAILTPDDPANISYTSGTTSDPKGIILTHGNYMVNVQQAYSLMDIGEDWVILLILPWDHAFAHTAGIFCFMGKGASIAAVQTGKTMMETLKNLPANIRQVRPHLLYSVPAIARNFRKNIEKGISEQGAVAMTLFRYGLKVSEIYNDLGVNRGSGWRWLLKPLVMMFDALIFSKIRAGFGGRLQYFIGGGALLDIELQKFFYAIGIPMLQGYGLTEASPLISANAFRKHKLGSSGLIVKELEVKICDGNGHALPQGEQGEIVIRGGNVMAGYWKNPEATAEAIRDGWLHTGDMGYVDTDGFLYVSGRFKSLLIADDGEKYSPEGMEEIMLAQSPFIEQIMLYNNQNPYTIALLFPNRERVARYLKEKGLEPGSEEGIKAALEKLAKELGEYRKGRRYGEMFPQRWLPAAIGVLPEGFSEENHLLNFQMKTVRGKVVERYSGLITLLYTPAGKDILNEENRKAMKRALIP
jgi:long-chain acyl-CoA synthetase